MDLVYTHRNSKSYRHRPGTSSHSRRRQMPTVVTVVHRADCRTLRPTTSTRTYDPQNEATMAAEGHPRPNVRDCGVCGGRGPV